MESSEEQNSAAIGLDAMSILLRKAQLDTVTDTVHLLQNLKRLLPLDEDKKVDDMVMRLLNMARTL